MIKKFHSKIVGVTHDNEHGSSRQSIINKYCFVGQELIPIWEKNNKFSKTAIALYVEIKFLFVFTNRYQIGHLNDKLAKEVIKWIKKEHSITIHITDLTGGGFFSKRRLGVNIYIQIEKPYNP